MLKKLIITSESNHHATGQKDHLQSTDIFGKIDELSDLINNAPIISMILMSLTTTFYKNL